ncbi:PAS domain-containing protein [Lactobacillus sp. PSON]|uniref:PAS domain-containing protein n=1 Tax=Lactobacillus sp. PSON TaxID=3455454 RepID=UPI0040430BEB
MTDEKNLDLKRQEHILKVLKFLQEGGDFTKASILANKSKDMRMKIASVKGHPLNTLYAENDAIKNLINDQLLPDLKKWQQSGKNEILLNRIRDELLKLHKVNRHYKRKENSLFSFLIKYNLITERTTSSLWELDDKIRETIKAADEAVNSDPLPDIYVIEAKIEKAAHEVLQMIFVENTIFLPILGMLLTPEDWYTIKQDELEIGYTLIDNPTSWMPTKDDIDASNWQHDQIELTDEFKKAYGKFLKCYLSIDDEINGKADEIQVLNGAEDYPVGESENSPDLIFKDVEDTAIKMEIGSLSLKEIPAIFNVLQIDLTFVDKYDRVKWFSNTDRIFPRTRSVIGRPVIRCHPPKSIDKVLKILDDFHNGYADSSDFWVNVHGRMIYMCFYAVRDNEDNYLGCLETVQDITKFKKIMGEKTLENQDQFKK